MNVFVYRSLKKNGYYLYLATENNFDPVPDNLLQALGELVPALTFELTTSRKLATENPETVLKNLQQAGYHLQITDPVAPLHTPDKAPASR